VGNFITGIISVSLGAIVLANVFVASAKGTVQDIGTRCISGWNGSACLGNTFTSSEYVMWGMISLAGIIGLVYGTLSIFGLV